MSDCVLGDLRAVQGLADEVFESHLTVKRRFLQCPPVLNFARLRVRWRPPVPPPGSANAWHICDTVGEEAGAGGSGAPTSVTKHPVRKSPDRLRHSWRDDQAVGDPIGDSPPPRNGLPVHNGSDLDLDHDVVARWLQRYLRPKRSA